MSLAQIKASAALFAGLALGATGCVDAFDGSHVALRLYPGVQVPGDENPGFGRPPSGTHYEIYTVQDGIPFYLKSFELLPVIDATDPCFIEDKLSYVPVDGRSLEGLHITRWYDKLLEIYESDGRITHTESGALADAQIRMTNLTGLHNGLIAIVDTPFGPTFTHDEVVALAADRAALAAAVPPPSDMTDAANADRAQKCKAFFTKWPTVYIGADRLISLPLDGDSYGMVDGQDPRTMQTLGGAAFRVQASFPDFQAFRINWQFNDPEDARIATYGASPIGYHYMAGTPVQRVRGAIHIPMRNVDYSTIAGEALVIPNLDQDEVQF